MAEQAEYKGFAKVEINGHNTHIGYVTTEAYGQAVLFRIDQPEIPEREETLGRANWIDGYGQCPAGAVVKRPKIEAASVLVGAGAIYRIFPCTEEVALKAIAESEHRPLILVKLPETVAQLAGGEPADEDDGEPDDEDEGVEPARGFGRFEERFR